jgi:hypothetical protein
MLNLRHPLEALVAVVADDDEQPENADEDVAEGVHRKLKDERQWEKGDTPTHREDVNDDGETGRAPVITPPQDRARTTGALIEMMRQPPQEGGHSFEGSNCSKKTVGAHTFIYYIIIRRTFRGIKFIKKVAPHQDLEVFTIIREKRKI